MDIMAKVEEFVEKLAKDDQLFEKFKEDPKATIKGLLGKNDDADDSIIEKLTDAVKAKVSLDKAGDLLGGLFGKKK